MPYVDSTAKGAETLVVSPTHFEGERITKSIRDGLRKAQLLGQEEHHFLALENANLTQAERTDAVNYVPGDVLVFHQNAKGYTKGDRLVVGRDKLPADQAARFQVFHPTEIAFAPGDMLRVTQNGKTADDKHRLNNGDLYRIQRFDQAGNIVLENGWKVAKDYGHLTYGYCVTSHASQGKSVDRVLIGQSASSFGASSREQFYVSVSRARKEATIYTDNQDELLKAVQRSDDRLTATELLSGKDWRERGGTIQRHELLAVRPPEVTTHKDREMIYDR